MVSRITKKFKFDMAHNLPDHEGLCNNLHGHTYHLEVTIEDNRHNNNMIKDFAEVKNIVNELVVNKLDHATMIYPKYAFEKELLEVLRRNHKKVIEVDEAPTVEMMAERILNILRKEGDLNCVKVKLYETPTSYAEVII